MERIKQAINKARDKKVSSSRAIKGHHFNLGNEIVNTRESSKQSWKDIESIQLNTDYLESQRVITYNRENKKSIAFDIFRTKLMAVIKHHNYKSIAITSPTPGCGKSIICSNLVFSLSHHKNTRVVLMDFDFRNPKLKTILGTNTRKNIYNVLNKELEIEDYLLKVKENVLVGFCDKILNNPSELISSENTKNVLVDIDKKYEPDLIIYDLPPILSGDDVMAFLPIIDLSILVVCSGHSKISDIKQSINILKEKSNYLGIVFNKDQEKINNSEYY